MKIGIRVIEKNCDNCLNAFVCQEYIFWKGLDGEEPDAEKCPYFKDMGDE